MIQPSTFDFLKKLKKNNNRDWVEKNRATMERAKEDFQQVTAALINEMGRFDPDIATLEAKRCIFRLNRDIRFSKNKAPYKTAMGAYMNRGGKKLNTAGYYFHAEPGNCFLAGGLWMPEPEHLAKVRQEIDYNLGEWKALLNNKSFKKYFKDGLDESSQLSRPPKGYGADNPALPFLKLKSFTVSMPLDDKKMFERSLIKNCSAAFQSLKPLIDFLNRALD